MPFSSPIKCCRMIPTGSPKSSCDNPIERRARRIREATRDRGASFRSRARCSSLSSLMISAALNVARTYYVGCYVSTPSDLRNPPAVVMLRSKMNIAEALLRIREHRGLTQKELGQRAGISRTDINAFEKGKSVGPARLQRLADALEVSVLELAPAAPPDPPGLLILDRLAKVEKRASKNTQAIGRASAALNRRLDALEARIDRLDPGQTETSSGQQ